MPKFYDWSPVRDELVEYDFQEHISSGGFKDVFLAKREGEKVVVKLLPIQRPSRKRRANREAEAMISIESPNFVDLNDYFETDIDGLPSFVMEEQLINGPTLEQKIERGGHGLDLGMELTDVLLELLIQFEDLNIIHRDIKPNNIMLDEEGEPILLDIGMVRFEERESITPDHLDRLGTPNYGAPEQLDYDKALQSIKTDIFSAGLVMFETITGIHPYSNTGRSISKAIIEGNKIGFSDVLADKELEEELDTIFKRMTHTEPHLRYRKPEFVREDFIEVKEMT